MNNLSQASLGNLNDEELAISVGPLSNLISLSISGIEFLLLEMKSFSS